MVQLSSDHSLLDGGRSSAPPLSHTTTTLSSPKGIPSGALLSHNHNQKVTPTDVYEATLPWWRAALRRRLVRIIAWESVVLANVQRYVRTPWLDAFFVYISSLGTHTFFMVMLPALFFFGHAELGRGLLIVLAMGVYLSSFIKDLVCSPRPFSPPVTRLTIGTHHLEYGFPSTHSTNSVSIALFLRSRVPASDTVLAMYVSAIVLGRLYMAMHGFVDCAMGILLGAAVWALYELAGSALDVWVCSGGWSVPLTVVPLGLLLVNQHPQPVDDCPCFEDAIAFVSVMMGSIVARWHGVRYGLLARSDADAFSSATGGGGAVWTTAPWVAVVAAMVKLVVGIGVIFAWRLAAKAALRAVLPPLFRALALGGRVRLPSRRFYTPATDYRGSVPAQGTGLRPIPSVIDLPGEMGVMVGGEEPQLKVRNGRRRKAEGIMEGQEVEPQEKNVVRHYDADVLTKVIVYSGIAVLAVEVLPVTFEMLGW